MLYRDTDTSRQFAAERHSELKRDWRSTDRAERAGLESRRDRRLRLDWLRTHLRSTGPILAPRAQ
jgi:hypothetical protein